MTLREDIWQGERVRNYTVLARPPGGDFAPVARGEAIGNKRIEIFADGPIAAAQLRLDVDASDGDPRISTFAAFGGDEC